ncbi:hypothetical protein LINGRAHAP2_LOCUS10059 [Linum grandiflorum]
MLKFLSKVRIEFNALDPRLASCMEFLAQCNAPKAKESNPACQVQVKRRTDDHPPQITVTFVNGVEEVFDGTETPAQTIRTMILEKGQYLETEQMFKEAGEKWPVIIPEEEIHMPAPGTKVYFLSFLIDCWLVCSLVVRKLLRIDGVNGFFVPFWIYLVGSYIMLALIKGLSLCLVFVCSFGQCVEQLVCFFVICFYLVTLYSWN